jgi:hypothetical protein
MDSHYMARLAATADVIASITVELPPDERDLFRDMLQTWSIAADIAEPEQISRLAHELAAAWRRPSRS